MPQSFRGQPEAVPAAFLGLVWMDKDLLYYEQKWASDIAMGVILSSPKPLWQVAIPFMFLFDFIKRGNARRRVAQYYVPPRETALSAAAGLERGKDAREEEVADACRSWLAGYRSRSIEAEKAAIDLVYVLIRHYHVLLKTGCTDMIEGIHTGYPRWKAYQQHLSALSAAENRLDEAVAQETGQLLRSEAEREEFRKHREKDLMRLYPDALLSTKDPL